MATHLGEKGSGLAWQPFPGELDTGDTDRMTPRPLHRWKSFWLGVFVVGFLAWAWWDSLRFESWMRWHGPPVTVSNGCGAIGVFYDSRSAAPPRPEWGRIAVEGVILGLPVSPLPPPMLVRAEGDEMDDPFQNPATQGWVKRKPPETYQDLLAVSYLQMPRGNWMLFIPHWLVMLAFAVPWAGFLFWKWRRNRNLTKTS